MKFTPEVIAALQTLKDAAENDFERHRINVLERDLTAPPKVEIIDDNHQKFEGLIFTLGDKKHYRRSSQMHRFIWEYYYGEIPENYVIHHQDLNPANNTIENLKLMKSTEHVKLHRAIEEQQEYTCIVCGKSFFAKPNCKIYFCSAVCNTKWRRISGTAYEEKICLHCGKIFRTRKDSKAKYCSTKCAAMERSKNSTEKRICPICGKSFEVIKSSKKVCCSHSCGIKFGWESTRKN